MQRNVERIIIFVLGVTLSGVYFKLNNHPVISTEIVDPQISRIADNPRQSDYLTKRQSGSLSEFELAKKLLLDDNYEAFIQRYANLRSELSETVIARYRQLMMQQITLLNNKNRNDQAYKLLLAYLEFEYDDVDALVLMARLHRSQGNYLAAIDTLYKARSYAHGADKITQTNRQIRSLVSAYKDILNTRSDPLALLELYGRLTELEPDYALNYIGLAEAHIALGNSEDARRALGLADLDPQVSDRARELLAKINQTPPLEMDGTSAVFLRRSGDQFAVEATLNGSIQVTLLLDTGASLSIISYDTLARLGVSSDESDKFGWFNTANGVVKAPIVSLAGLTVGGHIAENIEVGVMDVSESGEIDGLLGMNFLKLFKFYIDQGENKLHLQLR